MQIKYTPKKSALESLSVSGILLLVRGHRARPGTLAIPHVLQAWLHARSQNNCILSPQIHRTPMVKGGLQHTPWQGRAASPSCRRRASTRPSSSAPDSCQTAEPPPWSPSVEGSQQESWAELGCQTCQMQALSQVTVTWGTEEWALCWTHEHLTTYI